MKTASTNRKDCARVEIEGGRYNLEKSVGKVFDQEMMSGKEKGGKGEDGVQVKVVHRPWK